MKNEVFINLKLAYKMCMSMTQKFEKTNLSHQNDKHDKVPCNISKRISIYSVFNVAKHFLNN